MPSTLAQLEARVAGVLFDPTVAVWTTAVIDESIRQALGQYQQAAPLTAEALLTLPGDGRTIALNEVTGLLNVTRVWWPYDSAEDDDTNRAANLVTGFNLRFDDGQPIVDIASIDQPQTDDELYLWYTKPHTIQNLDSGSTTSLPADHESIIVLGACAYACFSRATDLNETAGLNTSSTPNYGALGSWYMERFQLALAKVRSPGKGNAGPAFGAAWKLDQWD